MKKILKKLFVILCMMTSVLLCFQSKQVCASSYGLSNPVRLPEDIGFGMGGDPAWDIIEFGRYPSGNPRYWRVLSVSGNDAFIMAEYGEDDDSIPYFNNYDKNPEQVVRWENSTIRKWLNTTFLAKYFTKEEQEAIKTSYVYNSYGKGTVFYGGNDTYDKIYLPSIDEMTNSEYGFSTDMKPSRTRQITGGGSYYWLRTTSQNYLYVSGSSKRVITFRGIYMDNKGYIDVVSGEHLAVSLGVRPVLHLDLSKIDTWKQSGIVHAQDRNWYCSGKSLEEWINQEETEDQGKIPSLDTPVLGEWEKTNDIANDPFVQGDGVTYSIAWGKVTGATGYQVMYSTNDNGTWIDSYSDVSNTSFSAGFSHIDMKIKAKVRAYVTVNGIKHYGNWSSEKTKTIEYREYAAVSFQDLAEKSFFYKNSKYLYRIDFERPGRQCYFGIWNPTGTSSSYEDFYFTVEDGNYSYRVKGARSGYYYLLEITPYSDYVRVHLVCENNSYKYFDILQNFTYEKVPCTISLNKTSLTLGKGKKYTLNATVSATTKTVKWKSSNKSVASVNSHGKVTAIKEGTTVITAEVNGVSVSCKITVLSQSNMAKNEYEKLLSEKYRGRYYAIVNAGKNKAPVLIVAIHNSPYLEQNLNRAFIPEYGYSIELYNYVNGEVKCLSTFIGQSISAGPWYLYKNKLVTYGRRGGIYTLNIKDNSFTRTFNSNGATRTFRKKAKVVKLTRND